MTALAKLSNPIGNVTQLEERRSRELYWRALNALARRGRVPPSR